MSLKQMYVVRGQDQTYQTSLLVFLLTFSSLAHAYVGPGAGLSAIGSVLAFIAACLLIVVGFVWYPIKRLLKRNKRATADQEKPPERESAPQATSEQGEQ